MGEWKIIDRGNVPENAGTIVYACPGCGTDASLPALGLPIAQIGDGVVFDNNKHSLPKIIQCRRCRRRYEAG